MISATAITYELDDIEKAAEELISRIRKKIDLKKESVAILHAQPEMESGELSERLSRELGLSVIGATTAGGALLDNDGHHELAVMLHVLSADDCLFSTSISPSMKANPKKTIIDTYKEALDGLKAKDAQAEPKMVLCITSIVQSYSSDDGLSTLSEASNGIPVFGYVAADDFQFCKQRVFLNGISGEDRMAILLISGNIRPIFEVKNLAGSQNLSKRRVTKAHDNIICEIDGNPAYEYIKEFPFITEETKVLWNYQFFVEMENETDNDGVLVSRALNSYDADSGEISCFANIPQNSYISLLYCDDNDVKSTCETALKELNEKIEKSQIDDYKYSTLLIASCSLRNMFLADQKDAEGNLVKSIIPESLTTSGIYAFGEIAPTSVRNGKAVNRFHNATMTMCAL